MKTLHIRAVDVVSHGVVVTYDDETRAFYDESVLMAHLEQSSEKPLKKRPTAAAATPARSLKRTA